MTDYAQLIRLGWNPLLEEQFRPYVQQGFQPARIMSQHKHNFQLQGPRGANVATVAGRLRHEAARKSDLPAVGDWVAIHLSEPEHQAVIHGVLPRNSRFA